MRSFGLTVALVLIVTFLGSMGVGALSYHLCFVVDHVFLGVLAFFVGTFAIGMANFEILARFDSAE